VAASGIPYVKGKKLIMSGTTAIIDTQFFVDHTEVNDLLGKQEDWKLGPLEDGQEFFAFVFSHDRIEH
jgi:hypothetical protein